MNRQFIVGLVLMALAVTACITTGDPGDDIVAVAPEWLIDGAITNPADPNQEAALLNKEAIKTSEGPLSKVADALDLFFPDEEVVAITSRKYLKEGTPPGAIFAITVPTLVNPVTGEVTPDTVGWIGQLLPTVAAAIPGAAPLVGIAGLLLSLFGAKRSRGHWVNALKAFVPMDGKSDWGATYNSVKKATGLMHTEESANELLESTLRIAKKEGLKLSINADGVPFLKELV